MQECTCANTLQICLRLHEPVAGSALQFVHSFMKVAGHVGHGDLQFGQHAQLLSFAREST